MFLNIETSITNILILAPFILSKVSYILDPSYYSYDTKNSSTTSNFIRSTTSLLSYSKIILTLHDTWYSNGPKDIDVKVTQSICTKILEAISSIRRKVDRIKLASEDQEDKNNIKVFLYVYSSLYTYIYIYIYIITLNLYI